VTLGEVPGEKCPGGTAQGGSVLEPILVLGLKVMRYFLALCMY